MNISQDQIEIPIEYQLAQDQPIEDIAPEDTSSKTLEIKEEPPKEKLEVVTPKKEEKYKVEKKDNTEIPPPPFSEDILMKPEKKCCNCDCLKCDCSCPDCSCRCWTDLDRDKKDSIKSYFYLLCHLGINYGFIYYYKGNSYKNYYYDGEKIIEKEYDGPGIGTGILIYLVCIALSALGIFVKCVVEHTLVALMISVAITFLDSLGVLYCSFEMYDPMECSLWTLMFVAFCAILTSCFSDGKPQMQNLIIVNVVVGIIGVIFSCYVHQHSNDFGWSVTFSIFSFLSSNAIHALNGYYEEHFCVFSPIYLLNFSGFCIVVAIAGACCGV